MNPSHSTILSLLGSALALGASAHAGDAASSPETTTTTLVTIAEEVPGYRVLLAPMTGSVSDGGALVAMHITETASFPGFNGFAQFLDTNIVLNAAKDTSFTSITGVQFDELLAPPTTDLLANNLIIKITSAGGTGTAGSITGFYYGSSQEQLDHDNNSDVTINSHGAHTADAVLTGVDISSGRVRAISGSSITINATANEIVRTGATAEGHVSANRIVGLKIGSSGSMGNTLRIDANSADDGVVIGVEVTGTQTVGETLTAKNLGHTGTLSRDDTGATNYKITTSTDTYQPTGDIFNTGGTSTGMDLRNTHAQSVQASMNITGVNSTGFLVSESKLNELNARGEIYDSSNNGVGVHLVAREDGTPNVHTLKTTMKVYGSYAGSDDDSALIRTEIDDFITLFDSDTVFYGAHSGQGIDLSATYGSGETRLESGLIYGTVTVNTEPDSAGGAGGAYLYDSAGNTTLGRYAKQDGEWVLQNAPDGRYSKSNIGIKVDANTGAGKTAVLNFGLDANIVTNVFIEGDTANARPAYGDVINYDTDKLILNTYENSYDINGNEISTTAGVKDAGGNPVAGTESTASKFRGDISYSGGDFSQTEVQFRTGNFEYESDRWYANTVSFGDANDKTVTNVRLKDSTKLWGSNELNFHINDIDEHAILVVDDGQKVDLADTNIINITLSTDYLDSHPEGEVTLIDGDILDAGIASRSNGEIYTFNISFVDELGQLEDALGEGYYITYGGTSYLYEGAGFQIALHGSSHDLILGGRGTGTPPDDDFIPDTDAIPEPSTATLSLLALTGLLARRRRRTS